MTEGLSCVTEKLQESVDHDPPSQAENVNINITEQKPFQPTNFKFPRKGIWQTNLRISTMQSGLQNLLGFTITNKTILCYVLFVHNNMKNLIFTLPIRVYLYLKRLL